MFNTFIAYGILLLSVFLFRKKTNTLPVKSKHHIGIGFIYIIIYSLIVGLRYDVGVDYLSYKNIFDQYALNTLDTPHNIPPIEPAFRFIYRCLTYLGLPYYTFFIITAFLNIFSLWLFSRQYKIITIWIFFFYVSSMTLFETFNQMRQMTAFFLFLCSIKYIANRCLFKYLISIILISLFHISILLMLPFYFFINRNILSNSIVASLILCGFFILQNPISHFVWDYLFPSISKLLIGIDATYYLQKTGDLFYNSNPTSLGIMHFIILIFDMLIISHISKMRVFFKQYSIDIFYNFFFIGACIYFISDGSIALVRLNTYFFNFLFIMLAFLMFFLSKSRSKFRIGQINFNIIYCLILILLSNCIYINAIAKGTKNAPYKFIYEQQY